MSAVLTLSTPSLSSCYSIWSWFLQEVFSPQVLLWNLYMHFSLSHAWYRSQSIWSSLIFILMLVILWKEYDTDCDAPSYVTFFIFRSESFSQYCVLSPYFINVYVLFWAKRKSFTSHKSSTININLHQCILYMVMSHHQYLSWFSFKNCFSYFCSVCYTS